MRSYPSAYLRRLHQFLSVVDLYFFFALDLGDSINMILAEETQRQRIVYSLLGVRGQDVRREGIHVSQWPMIEDTWSGSASVEWQKEVRT